MTPVRVRAFCHYGKWHDIEVEDDVTAYFEYPNGATGTFITSTADAPGTNRFEVSGSMGKLVCEDNRLTFFKNALDERLFNKQNQAGFGAPEFTVTEVETDGENPQHAGILRNFTDFMLGRGKLFVDGKEGLASVALMNAMEFSAWKDITVEMPIDGEAYYKELYKRIISSRWKDTPDRVLDIKNSQS